MYSLFYFQAKKDKHAPVIEQLGTYDPLPNEYNEKLVALNYERIRYWIGNGAVTSKPVEQLFGIFLKFLLLLYNIDRICRFGWFLSYSPYYLYDCMEK